MRRVRLLLALAVALAVGLIAAPSASAAIPGSYTFTTFQGVPYKLLSGSSNLIIPATGATDDALFTLSRARGNQFHLPFRLNVYGTSYGQVRVSSNGNLQFGVGTGGSAAFTNDPLPSADFSGPTLMPFWDDLFMVPSDTSHVFREGIFTLTSGTAPHRKFYISWQGHAFNNESYLVLAEAIFTEGSSTIRFRYGTDDCQGTFLPSETIGAQRTGNWTQIVFDPPCSGLVSAGTQFTLVHH